MPAKPGNRNALSHGAHSFLATGRAPKGCGYIYRMMGQLKRHLEAEIVTNHGAVSTYHACVLQSLIRHESRAAFLTRWLRESESPSVLERLALLKEIGSATDARDRCVKLLGLDRANAHRVIDVLYSNVDETEGDRDGSDNA